ncbi:hypothetical protein ACIO6T_39210 [Streptomyces sp. NPDC087532]|uniref:hypothetical protein n=1 Tax=Streptomyces sp. NPDC087532 TaxID=3365795 RepID=UPI0037FACDBD
MSWTITPELVVELSECNGDPTQIGIVLGANGWERDVCPSGIESGRLTALTLETVRTWLDGTEMDDEAAEAIATVEDFRILREDDSPTPPGEDTEWAVITGAVTDHEHFAEVTADDVPWERARWFDTAAATFVLDADPGTMRAGHGFTLWCTDHGQGVAQIWNSRAVGNGQWATCTKSRAAELIYAADEELINAGDLPLLARAARAARELADLMDYPVPDQHLGPERREALADRQRAAAISHEGTARAIGDLVRTRTTADIRRGRQGAAYTLYLANGRNVPETYAELNLGRTTFLGLINE